MVVILDFDARHLSKGVKNDLNRILTHKNMGIDTKIITICLLLIELQLILVIDCHYGGHFGFS